MYDEIRYSLENRDGNKTNGLIAVYTPETERMLIEKLTDGTICVNKVDNLFRKNMMNIKNQYKRNPNPDLYNRDYDSYCSLISWDDFTNDIGYYIDIAEEKREELFKYNICSHLQ